jgi:DNA mismatch repair ATPase MutS
MVASHLAELAAGLQTLRSICFLHFAGEVSDEQVQFDYHLREGVSEQRLGMLILERDGVLERLRRLRG